MDAGTSVGTALTPNGGHRRLVFVAPDRTIRELRRHPVAARPRFLGFVAGDGWLAWAETTGNDYGQRATQMWGLRLAAGEPARLLTAQAGVVSFDDSRYDLVIADRRLYWTSAGGGSRLTTDVHSLPLEGGAVRTKTRAGVWHLAVWPWLVGTDRNGAIGGPLRLVNQETGRSLTYLATAAEMPVCGATWCRSVILLDSGVAGLDVVRVDGSDRRRMPVADAASPLADVALRDRFEVLTSFARRAAGGSGRRLVVYDIAHRSVVTIAEDAGAVASRGDFLWWSSYRDSRWQSIDLRTIR